MGFNILSRQLNVFEPHFLEASAGTGKTFAIEHLVTRLLLETERPLTIEQILVVTFTRAATRELKMRIRRNLLRAKEELQKTHPTIDYLQAICEKGDPSIQLAIERIDAALICYDLAQIYTLHGFCHSILNEFAFEAGISMDVEDPDEKMHISYLVQMVKDHLKEHLCLPSYSAFQAKSLLKKYQSQPRKMIHSLVNFITGSTEIGYIPAFEEHFNLFISHLNGLPSIDPSLFKEDLSLLIPCYKQMTSDEIPLQIDLLSHLLEAKTCTHAQFDSLLKRDFFLEKMQEENQKVRAKFPTSSALHYPDLLLRLQQTLLPSIQAARDTSRTFLRLGRDLQERCRDLLEKKEAFSPDGLLLKVEQALKVPAFIKNVREKFRAAIIDEFQDTDPIQWNIFQELFVSKLDAICLVGDPKQSIYAFRNADLYVYLQAAKALGPDAKKFLDTNFRSTPSLVSALNLLFSRAQKGWMSLPQTNTSLEVIPVKAGVTCADEGIAPVEFFIASEKKGRSKKFPTANMLEKKVFPYLASEIKRLNQEKGIEYHNIALLIKDRFQAEAVIDYLKKKGIPASSKRGGSLVLTDAFFALKEILGAVCSSLDMGKIKAALGGPLLSFSEEEIKRGSDDPFLLQLKAKMQLLKSILFEKGFGPFFQNLMTTCWRNEEPLIQELFARGEGSLYLDLRRLCEVLIEEELKNGLKAQGFLPYLEALALETHPDDPRLKVPLQEEKGSVTVMTMHMSKGLEFEVVFALGIASRHPLSDQVRIKQEGRHLIVPFDPLDKATIESLEEIDAEKMRQLYVALTRAKQRLYIPLFIEEECKQIPLGEASAVELFFAKLAKSSDSHIDHYQIVQNNTCKQAIDVLNSLSPLITYRILEEGQEKEFEPELKKAHGLVAPAIQLPPTLSQQELLSFSSLSRELVKSHWEEGVKGVVGTEISLHTMPPGSHTGQLIHLVFEKIFKRRLHHLANLEAVQEVIDEVIAFSPLDPWRPLLLPWITEILTKQLPTFTLSEIPPQQLQQEVEFFFPVKRGMMKGFADLLFQFQGKYYILDWKSNYLGPSDADYTQQNMAQAMQHHRYDLQAEIYANALERYVKLFDNRPFPECFGGAIYYFVRGKAAYIFMPDWRNLDGKF